MSLFRSQKDDDHAELQWYKERTKRLEDYVCRLNHWVFKLYKDLGYEWVPPRQDPDYEALYGTFKKKK